MAQTLVWTSDQQAAEAKSFQAPHLISDAEAERLRKMREWQKRDYYPNWASDYEKLCGAATTTPKIGMSRGEIYATTLCFAKSSSKTTTAFGTREQVIYRKEAPTMTGPYIYLYFDNDVLTAIQE